MAAHKPPVCVCSTNLYMGIRCCTMPFYATLVLLSLSWASKFRHTNAVSSFTTVICFTPLTFDHCDIPLLKIIYNKINFTCKYYAHIYIYKSVRLVKVMPQLFYISFNTCVYYLMRELSTYYIATEISPPMKNNPEI